MLSGICNAQWVQVSNGMGHHPDPSHAAGFNCIFNETGSDINLPDIFSQTGDSVLSTRAKNVMYVEVASILYFGWGTINYERIFTDNLSIRAGFGGGYAAQLDYPMLTGYGVLLMFNYFTKGPRHRFEAGIGVSMVQISGNFDDYTWAKGRVVYPALSVSYRYQPREGGFFFRGGLTFHSAFGTPIQITIGHVW